MRYLKHWGLNFAAWVGLYVLYATAASAVDDKPFWGYGGPLWIFLPMVGLTAITALVTQRKPPRPGHRGGADAQAAALCERRRATTPISPSPPRKSAIGAGIGV